MTHFDARLVALTPSCSLRRASSGSLRLVRPFAGVAGFAGYCPRLNGSNGWRDLLDYLLTQSLISLLRYSINRSISGPDDGVVHRHHHRHNLVLLLKVDRGVTSSRVEIESLLIKAAV